MTLAARAAADLRWVSAYWPDLAESRMHDTPAPFRRPQMTAEQRDDRDWEAQMERWERTADAIGASPAPVRVPVLDVLTGLLAEAVLLADELAHAARCPELPPPSSDMADARPYLRFAGRRIAELDRAGEFDPIANAHRQTRVMVATVARGLGLVYDGHALEVVCPWCKGVTPESPAGGAHTWRVRDLLGHRACAHGQPDRRFCDRCDQ
ncbi:hypothetical protein [Herbidospora mongoliensis]|uniref:hypothetical protein n=1 Tax=Herbidospora mongoliensis TaxID=688067 RepID=UPI00082C1804|nr:hypothetical protein [Herbidospora mongoliensis]